MTKSFKFKGTCDNCDKDIDSHKLISDEYGERYLCNYDDWAYCYSCGDEVDPFIYNIRDGYCTKCHENLKK